MTDLPDPDDDDIDDVGEIRTAATLEAYDEILRMLVGRISARAELLIDQDHAMKMLGKIRDEEIADVISSVQKRVDAVATAGKGGEQQP